MFKDNTFPQKVKITNNILNILKEEFEDNEIENFNQICNIVFDIVH